MSDTIKETIDKILLDKKGLIISKLHNVQEQIINELEELTQLDGFEKYTLPNNLGMLGTSENNIEQSTDDTINHIYKYTKQISAAVNQLSLINSILEGINHYCNRSALFLLRDDKLVGWKGKGFSGSSGSIEDEEVKKVFFSLSADTIFKKVLNSKEAYLGAPNSQPDDHLVYSRFGGDLPETVFIVPFFVKGKPQAVIYTDIFKSGSISNKEIEILATVGEMSLDLLPLKQKILAKVKTQEFVDDPYAKTKTEFQDPMPEIEENEPVSQDTPFKSIKMNDPARKARVIINDIIMYNPDVVKKGLNGKNLAEVLKDTLAQAREEYLRKYNDLTIFEEQLIQILAKGDRSALDGYNFEKI